MKTKNAMTGTKSLKWFLIQRFLLIMAFVYISEELLSMGYRFVVVPFLVETMNVRFSVTASDGSVLLLMLKMVVYSAAAFLMVLFSIYFPLCIPRNTGSS